MLPAHQCFDCEDLAGAEVNLGLVEQRELGACKPIAHLLLQHELLVNPVIHFGGVKLHVVAACFLGLVHGGIGVHEQRFRIAAVIGEGCNPCTAGDIEGPSIN